MSKQIYGDGYLFLNKCQGTCEKRKDVSASNCIGIHPQHKDCKYRVAAGFHSGFCPYYCPATDEKNYKSDIADIEGVRYMRRPFDVVWYPVLFVIVMILICSVIRGGLFTFSSFFVATAILSLCSLLISSTGNYVYTKLKGNKLVAIVNEDGMYTPRLFLSWEKMKRIKVHYALPRSARGTSYFIELECVMKVEDALQNRKVFISIMSH